MPTKTDSLSQSLSQKIQSKLSQTRLPKMLQEQIETRLNGTLGEKIDESAQLAKAGIDQALIALEHRGINLKDSPEKAQELAHKIGRKVLERAEAIRSEIATKPFTPAWLKDVSLAPTTAAADDARGTSVNVETTTTENMHVSDATSAASMTESTVSEAAADAQPEAGAKKAKKTSSKKRSSH